MNNSIRCCRAGCVNRRRLKNGGLTNNPHRAAGPRDPHCTSNPDRTTPRPSRSRKSELTRMSRGECRGGSAPTFEEARAQFERAWMAFSANRTEAHYEEWRAYGRPSLSTCVGIKSIYPPVLRVRKAKKGTPATHPVVGDEMRALASCSGSRIPSRRTCSPSERGSPVHDGGLLPRVAPIDERPATARVAGLGRFVAPLGSQRRVAGFDHGEGDSPPTLPSPGLGYHPLATAAPGRFQHQQAIHGNRHHRYRTSADRR